MKKKLSFILASLILIIPALAVFRFVHHQQPIVVVVQKTEECSFVPRYIPPREQVL